MSPEEPDLVLRDFLLIYWPIIDLSVTDLLPSSSLTSWPQRHWPLDFSVTDLFVSFFHAGPIYSEGLESKCWPILPKDGATDAIPGLLVLPQMPCWCLLVLDIENGPELLSLGYIDLRPRGRAPYHFHKSHLKTKKLAQCPGRSRFILGHWPNVRGCPPPPLILCFYISVSIFTPPVLRVLDI